jgi:hypothetical protein
VISFAVLQKGSDALPVSLRTGLDPSQPNGPQQQEKRSSENVLFLQKLSAGNFQASNLAIDRHMLWIFGNCL